MILFAVDILLINVEFLLFKVYSLKEHVSSDFFVADQNKNVIADTDFSYNCVICLIFAF